MAAELENNHLTQAIARELAFVQPKRQLEIVTLMKDTGDCSTAFAKAQVLATPSHLRSKKKRGITPWQRGQNTKRDLVKKLAEVEKHYDFYSALYRQYVGDLLKLAIYIRQIVSRAELRDHLAEHHPDDLKCFESVTGQALWDNMAAHISGEGVQPGIEGYWITEQRVGSRLAGFAGQFNLSATGRGTETMPPELQQALIAQGMEDAALRARIVEWLTRPAGPEDDEGGAAEAPATSTQPAGP